MCCLIRSSIYDVLRVGRFPRPFYLFFFCVTLCILGESLCNKKLRTYTEGKEVTQRFTEDFFNSPKESTFIHNYPE